jgi:hypothetical protein
MHVCKYDETLLYNLFMLIKKEIWSIALLNVYYFHTIVKLKKISNWIMVSLELSLFHVLVMCLLPSNKQSPNSLARSIELWLQLHGCVSQLWFCRGLLGLDGLGSRFKPAPCVPVQGLVAIKGMLFSGQWWSTRSQAMRGHASILKVCSLHVCELFSGQGKSY